MQESNNINLVKFKNQSDIGTKTVKHLLDCCIDHPSRTIEISCHKMFKKLMPALELVEKFQADRIVVCFTHENILSSLHHIDFPRLTQLCVHGCNIETIENLSRMSLPSIRKLSLRDNRITNIKSLRKIYTKSTIQQLVLDGNLVQEIQSLPELESSFKNIYFDFVDYDRPCGLNLAILAKTQTQKNSFILVKAFKRLKQPKIAWTFSQKGTACIGL